MKILHLSDLHITENGKRIWDTDTKSHFDRAIDIIKRMHDIEAIIVTGDLSDDGSEWSYSYIDKAFEEIGLPTYCCPGNHDNITKLSEMKFCLRDNVANFDSWKLLNLDSSIPGMARGFMNAETMALIKQELSKDTKPTIIAFHHPCIEPGGWLNRKLLENRQDFNQYILTQSAVKLVLYGHSHYPVVNISGDIMFSSAPSVGFAFDKDLPKFQIAKGKEGFNIISLSNENITIETKYLI